jgi:hypothetical protein
MLNTFDKDPTVNVIDVISDCGFTQTPAEKLLDVENVGLVSVVVPPVTTFTKDESRICA